MKYWYFSTEAEKEKNFCYYLNQKEECVDYSEDNDEDSEKIDFHSLAKHTLERHNLAKFKL